MYVYTVHFYRLFIYFSKSPSNCIQTTQHARDRMGSRDPPDAIAAMLKGAIQLYVKFNHVKAVQTALLNFLPVRALLFGILIRTLF